MATAVATPRGSNRLFRRYAARSLPRTSGTIRLDCLEAPVEVVRDRFGVPHLRAAGLHDLVRAQGYVHAQDRLFQMELLRRRTFGRLAEVFGARALDHDRISRRFRIGWAAEREAELLDDETRRLATSYCEGVNAFLASGPMPVELRLARVRPARWRPADVLAPGKLLALSLSGNWHDELLRAWMIERLGAERAARLEPGESPQPATVPGAPRAAPSVPEGRGASNSWVVGGARSARGKPLLAADPHVSLTSPALFHVQRLVWDGGGAAGLTVPGSPAIVAGRNERVAWALTSANVDTQDLYVERFSPDGRRYEVDGSWAEADVLRQEIPVRWRRRPVVEDVVVTRHGPLVEGPDPRTNEALALRWSALEPAHTLAALLRLHGATSVEEADTALDGLGGAALNVLLADVDGDIGYRLAGGPIPFRAHGAGRTPARGWDSSSEWRDWIPSSELPRLRNPAGALLVAANDRIVDESYPHYLSAEYANGYRARRIRALLERAAPVDVDGCRRIQLDRLLLPGLELAELAKDLESDDPLERAALELLREWDGRSTADGAAAAVYGILMRRLQDVVFEELRVDGRPGGLLDLYERTRPAVLELVRSHDPSFFGNGRTAAGALSKALAATVETLGPEPERWAWGAHHRVLFSHPLGLLPVVGGAFRRGPFPIGGTSDTVWQMACPLDDPGSSVGPAARVVFDLADDDVGWFIVAPGQSGHPASPHYDDLLGAWSEGELMPLALSRSRLAEVTESRLLLEPCRPTSATRGL
jgi:penicillin G amidase